MPYLSTRANHPASDAATAIRLGMVPAGGLFLPDSIPALDPASLAGLEYPALATRILSLFLDGYGETELSGFCSRAYAEDRFPVPAVTPLCPLDARTTLLELWHGPTAAFKDLALQLLPHLLGAALHKQGTDREVVILVATSGDTGKAALEGFRDVPGTRVFVFYPKGGVSRTQELQMQTAAGSNVAAVGVRGNFDDCQTMVKRLFADPDYNTALHAAGFELSSANSINWGRLVPQVVYYYHAWLQSLAAGRVAAGEDLVFVVPTGNFGNILAAWYAKRMGLPIRKLVCASNANNVLTDFFRTGTYDSRRPFYRTTSPSMDILVSSNLERYLFEACGRDGRRINGWYGALQHEGSFRIDPDTHAAIQAEIFPGFAGETEIRDRIASCYRETECLVDPHTAVGLVVLDQYRSATGDTSPAVVASTASPFKFSQAVLAALGETTGGSEQDQLERLTALTGTTAHRSLTGLESLPVRHDMTIDLADGAAMVRRLLGVG